MKNDSMGNLEKLGILVIVILVVVVGVVAITPEETLFPERGPAVADGGDGHQGGDVLADRLPRRDDRLEAAERLQAAKAAREAREKLSGDAPVWPDRGGPQPKPEPDPVEPLPPSPPPPVPEPEPTPEPAPKFREYTVCAGDSFYRIAETELGSSSRWKDIAAANPDVDPLALRPGKTVLRIPTAAARSARAGGDEPPEPPQRGGSTYVVKAGDTPMGISQQFFGTTRHWRAILEFNGISDPNGLRRDATLRIPELAQGASPNTAPNTAAISGGARTYHVEKGDSLIAIARHELGDAARWTEIRDLNGMDGPADLRADVDIRLPVR